MNVLDEVVEQALKIAINNHDILQEIQDKSKDLMIADIFNISRIFVSRKSKNVDDTFTLEEFQKQDPEGYFNKIVKAFCQSLIDISQEPISDSEKKEIIEILSKVRHKS